jgi:hypothetical protein
VNGCLSSDSRVDLSPVPAIQDRRPGRFVRHLDFNHFRTIGMRRLVGEGRFVTGERLEAMLKVCSSSHSVSLFRLTLYRRKYPTSPHLVQQSIWTVP